MILKYLIIGVTRKRKARKIWTQEGEKDMTNSTIKIWKEIVQLRYVWKGFLKEIKDPKGCYTTMEGRNEGRNVCLIVSVLTYTIKTYVRTVRSQSILESMEINIFRENSSKAYLNHAQYT